MARKMLLVSEDAMKRAFEKQQDPAARERNDLDAEMNRIMNDRTLDMSEKWKLYQQVLHRYLNVKDEPIKVSMDTAKEPLMRDFQIKNTTATAAKHTPPAPPPPLSTSFTGDNDNLLQFIPKTYRSKGKQLMQYLSQNNVRWNEMGEVIIDNKTISGIKNISR